MAARPKPSRTQSKEAIAETLDVHVKTVISWANDGCPHDRSGPRGAYRFNEAEVAAWLRREGRNTSPGRPSESESPDIEAARLRKENALADKYELQVARERGRLVDAAEVKRLWGNIAGVVRNQFAMLGSRVAGQCVGRDAVEIQKVIEQRVDEYLEVLSRDGIEEAEAELVL